MASAPSQPPGPRLPLLYVDDEPENLELFSVQFEDRFPIRTASSGVEALRILEREQIGLLLTDERMGGMTGIELLSRVESRWPDIVRVIVSAYCDADRLLGAMNRGHAHEYVLKPWSREELGSCIERGLAMAQRRRQLSSRAELAEALSTAERAAHDPGQLVGARGGLAPVMAQARRAAQSDATVLIHGETGTGKELLARFIHEESARASGPFVRLNCGALNEGVLESELFGHEKGAFTGAVRERKGRFELAHGGTLFLDEIGDISPKLQVSLLRVLQEGELERVGGSTVIRVDVRIVCATHRNLEERVRGGQFREDLYYRLNVLPLELTPLRERPQDLPELIQHFIAKHSLGSQRRPELEPEALRALARYSWPGNVRELENLVQRALVLSAGPTLTLEDFCLRLPSLPPPEVNVVNVAELREKAQLSEAEQVRELLFLHGGNCARAARALGVPRTTFTSRAKKHGLL